MTTYRDAGVDVGLSDLCSKIFYDAAKETFANRRGRFGQPAVERGGFSGPIYVPELRDAYIVKNSDGVGTKVEIAEQLNKHDTIAFDLVAMVCDDAIALGAEPFALTETLNVNTLKRDIIEPLAEGLVVAAKRARVAVVGGEIAVLGDRIRGEYIWDADVNGVLEVSKKLPKESIQPGDKIVALQERGFRSNGFSLIRHILNIAFGSNWVHESYNSNLSWGDVVLEPSIIYTPVIVDAIGGYREESRVEIKAVAHITGGGIPGNLPRALPVGMGAQLDISTPDVMRELQNLGQVSDSDAYQTWNMGAGMLVVCNGKELSEIAESHGVSAEVVGEIIGQPVLKIRNRGFFESTTELVYEI
jgi:phosphoribosylformylglycinamidine cyclo-ligase